LYERQKLSRDLVSGLILRDGCIEVGQVYIVDVALFDTSQHREYVNGLADPLSPFEILGFLSRMS